MSNLGSPPKIRTASALRPSSLAGICGSVTLVAITVTLSIVQYGFMVSAGWRPLTDPGGAWPSGLALGPYGWAMNAAFLTSGVLLSVFSLGLERGLPVGSRSGTALLFASGVAMALLAFETDPILREGPRSVHGWIHDAAFVVFALAFPTSLFFLWRRMRTDTLWKNHARYTLATGVVATVCLFLPGVAYYVFVVVLVAWIPSTALKLPRSTPSPRQERS